MAEKTILLYSPLLTPRLQYAGRHIGSMLPGAVMDLTSSRDEAVASSGPVINYSAEPVEGALNVMPSGLLGESGVRPLDVVPAGLGGRTVIFPSPGGDDLGFDIFSAAFYMLSRYEEYLPAGRDRHGRFPWQESMACRYGLSWEPLVDHWAGMLMEAISQRYPAVSFPEREFRFIPTIDVDVPWAYRNRGLIRTIGGFAKAAATGNVADLKTRYRVLFRGWDDPYDTYDRIRMIHSEYGVTPVFFFSAGSYGRFDKSVSPQNKEYRRLIMDISAGSEWGIHPSYRSFGQPERLDMEMETLARITGEAPVRSRNHYLRFSFPESCRMLDAAGIREDYTLGWAEMTGFRAGTCTPFPFYDLEREEAGSLTLFPFQVMDGTLCDYMKLDSGEAAVHGSEIAARVRQTGGTLVTLWHNETFSGQGRWRNWEKVYLEIIKTAMG